MSAYTNLKNKLKQFGIELDKTKIYEAEIKGKRDDIFQRAKPSFYKRDAWIWSTAYDHIKNLKATFYTAEIQCQIHTDRDIVNEGLYQAETEWSGYENGIAVVTIIKKSTGKFIKAQIG